MNWINLLIEITLKTFLKDDLLSNLKIIPILIHKGFVWLIRLFSNKNTDPSTTMPILKTHFNSIKKVQIINKRRVHWMINILMG